MIDKHQRFSSGDATKWGDGWVALDALARRYPGQGVLLCVNQDELWVVLVKTERGDRWELSSYSLGDLLEWLMQQENVLPVAIGWLVGTKPEMLVFSAWARGRGITCA